jgi:hypothetical protein
LPQGTNLSACTGGDPAAAAARGAQPPATSSCQLPPWLSFSAASTSQGVFASTTTQQPGQEADLLCPALAINSFEGATKGVPSKLLPRVAAPFGSPLAPGLVVAGGSLTGYAGCSCAGPQQVLQRGGGGGDSDNGWHCAAAGEVQQGMGAGERSGYISGLVVLGVVPQLLVALAVFLFFRWVLLDECSAGRRQTQARPAGGW